MSTGAAQVQTDSVPDSQSCDQSLLRVLLFNHQTVTCTHTHTRLSVRTRQRAVKTSDSKVFFQASLCQTSCFCDFLHMYICVRCRDDSVDNQRAQAHWGDSLFIVKDLRQHPRHHCSIMPALYVYVKRCVTLASLPPMHMLFDVQIFCSILFCLYIFLLCQTILCKYFLFINFTLIFWCFVYNFPSNKITIWLV